MKNEYGVTKEEMELAFKGGSPPRNARPEERMKAWNPTWQANHLPEWFATQVEIIAIEEDRWTRGLIASDYFPLGGLFDHWGSAVMVYNQFRSVITQPYVADADELNYYFGKAQDFADRHEFRLFEGWPGHWGELGRGNSTAFIVFKPNTKQMFGVPRKKPNSER